MGWLKTKGSPLAVFGFRRPAGLGVAICDAQAIVTTSSRASPAPASKSPSCLRLLMSAGQQQATATSNLGRGLVVLHNALRVIFSRRL